MDDTQITKLSLVAAIIGWLAIGIVFMNDAAIFDLNPIISLTLFAATGASSVIALLKVKDL